MCFHQSTTRWGNEEPGNYTHISLMPRNCFTIYAQFGNNFKFWGHNDCIFVCFWWWLVLLVWLVQLIAWPASTFTALLTAHTILGWLALYLATTTLTIHTTFKPNHKLCIAYLISCVLVVVNPPLPPSDLQEPLSAPPPHPSMMRGPTTASYGIICHSCYNVQQYYL